MSPLPSPPRLPPSPLLTMTKSTGSPRVVSLPSRTRPLADHAGLSPPPVPWKELTSLPPANSSLAPSLTTLAMEAPWPSPSDSTRITPPSSRPTTLTPPEPVRSPLAILPSPLPMLTHLLTPWSPPTTPTNSRPPSLRDPSPSPSRPTNPPSRCTSLVSSPDLLAEPNSITVSSPSDTEPRTVPLTTSSRTLGAPPGEMPDTSRSELSPVLVSAVSRSTPSSPPLTELSLLPELVLQSSG